MRHIFAFAALLAFALLAPALVSADELYMRDGRVIEGDIVPGTDPAVIDVKVGSGSMVVVQHVQAAQVTRVVTGKSARQTSLEDIGNKQKELGKGGEAEDWWHLAERARDQGDQVLFRELAAETVQRDRQHAAARKALGMVKYKGVWMRANEAAIARGEVQFNGHWMSWPDREKAVVDQAKRQELAQARRDELDKRRAAARIAASSSDLTEPYPSIYTSNYYEPRVVYWHPNYCPPQQQQYVGGNGLTIQATGGNSNSHWSFSWNY